MSLFRKFVLFSAGTLGVLHTAPYSFGEDATPRYLTEAEAAKNLPPTLPPERFTDPQVKRAYEVAQRIPKVLAQQPCFCWCSRGGHRSLLDCYVGGHAAMCDICMKEAFLADQMTRNGKHPDAVRAAVIRGEWRNL